MTRDEGHQLLNKLKEGQTFFYDEITAALVATGDVAGWYEGHLFRGMATGMRSEGLDQAVQTAHQGTGASGSGCLVAANQGRDIEGAWPGWSKYLDKRHEQD